MIYLPTNPTVSHQVSIEQEINLAWPKPWLDHILDKASGHH